MITFLLTWFLLSGGLPTKKPAFIVSNAFWQTPWRTSLMSELLARFSAVKIARVVLLSLIGL
jgi:hypothetical protein